MSEAARVRPLFDSSYGLVAPLAIGLLLLFVVPLLRVLWLGFSDPAIGLQNYITIAASPGVRAMLWTTAWLSASTTGLALLVGYALAWALYCAGPTQRAWMLAGLLFSLWVSVLVRAFAWVVVLGDQGVVNRWLVEVGLVDEPLRVLHTPIAVIIGMVHYMVPLAALPIFNAMQAIDRRILQAGRSLGASPSLVFRRVFFPLTMPGVLSAAILVFVFSLGFYVTPAILGGGRTIMIAEFIGRAVLDVPQWGVAAACATLLLAVTFALMAALARIADLRTVFGGRP
jgi:putative spermidine/putrescine transport system permease protein